MKIIVEKCNPTIENDNILIQYNLNSAIYTHLGSLLLSQKKKKKKSSLLLTCCSCINKKKFRGEILIAIDCIN